MAEPLAWSTKFGCLFWLSSPLPWSGHSSALGERCYVLVVTEGATILEGGRAAYARREWRDAFLAFEEADQQLPLDVDDLEFLTWSAALAGRDEEFLKCLERLTQVHLDAERFERA